MGRYIFESDCGCGCEGSGGCGDRQEESNKMGKGMHNVMFPEGTVEGDLVMDEDGNYFEVVSLGESDDLEERRGRRKSRRKKSRRKARSYGDYLKSLGKDRVSRKGGKLTRTRGSQRRKKRMTPAEFRAQQRKNRMNRNKNRQKSRAYRRRTGKATLKRRRQQSKRLRGEEVMESLGALNLSLLEMEDALDVAIEEGLMDQIETDPAGGYDVDVMQPMMDYGSALSTNAAIANNLAMMAGSAEMGVMQVEAIEDLAECLEEDAEDYEIGEMSDHEALDRVRASASILSDIIESLQESYEDDFGYDPF